MSIPTDPNERNKPTSISSQRK